VVRIPDLLRAAAVLDRSTAQQIAISTGIGRSRVERLLTGRTPPRNDEVARILAACGADPGLVTTPRLTGAGALPARTVFGLLLNREHHADRDVDTSSSVLSTDYLSLSFDAPTDALLALARDAGDPRRAKHAFYRHEYLCRAGILVQHGFHGRRRRRRDSRISFNPSRVTRKRWPLVRRVLSLASRVRVTRLDVAVDLPGRYQPLTQGKWRMIGSFGGVETFYIGARKSDRQIRVYDKRRQMIETERADGSYPETTRVEVQLRNLKLTADGKRRAMSVSDLSDLQDPFAKFALVDLASGLPFPLLLCASWADAFGAQALRPLVTPSEFDAVVKRLPTIDGAHLSRVFDAQWPSAASELLRNLGIT
jgi:hypothetical protein